MKSHNKAAGEYVEAIDWRKWARPFFPARRFGHVTSNMAESINRWLDDVRHCDPVGIFVCFVRQLNSLFYKRREKYAEMDDEAVPKNVAGVLDVFIDEGWDLDVTQHSATVFDVEKKSDPRGRRVVDLNAQTCSCGYFKEHGIPCRHICAALHAQGIDPRQFVIPERRVRALKAMYAGVTVPVETELLFNDGTLPPIGTKRRGRPKEKRIPSAAEKGPKRTVTCGKCGGRGHNARRCHR